MDSTEAPFGKGQKEAQTEEGGFAVVPKSHIHYNSSADTKQARQAGKLSEGPKWLLNVRAWLNKVTLGRGGGF